MKKQRDNERGALPSASAAHRWLNCPGSVALAAQAPRVEPGPEAQRGTRIHAALASCPLTAESLPEDSISVAALALEDLACARRCWAIFNDLRREWEMEQPADDWFREQRLWLYDNQHRRIMSGQPDIFGVRSDDLSDSVLLVDYKSGRTENPSAYVCEQLWVLAVLIYHQDLGKSVTPDAPAEFRIRMALICPETDTEWSAVDLNQVEVEHFEHQVLRPCLENIAAGNAPLVPGPWCHYCPAVSLCKEATGEATLPVPIAETNPGAISDMTDETLGQFAGRLDDMLARANSLYEAVETELKSRIADGRRVPGWRLAPGSDSVTITDPSLVWKRALGKGVRPEDFLGCVKIGKEKLGLLLKKATGTAGQDLERHLAEVLAGCEERTPKAPSLKREP